MKVSYFSFFLCICLAFLHPASAERPTVVGVIAPLTGGAAELGSQIRNGLELAREELGGKVVFQYEDEACDARTALTAAQKLSESSEIKIIIGPLCSPPYLSVAPVLNRAGIVFIHSSSGTQNTAKAKGEYGIEGTATVMEENDYLTKHLVGSSLMSTAVINFEQEWATGHAEAFIESYQKLGGTISTHQSFANANEDNFRPLITKVLLAKPQALFVAAWNAQTASILKQARQLGLAVPVFAQYDVEDPALIALAGPAADGLRYMYPFDNDELSPAARSFAGKYEERFGIRPSFYPFNGYDLAMLVSRALDRCALEKGGSAAKCLREKIIAADGYEGLTGKIGFSGDGSVKRNFVLKEIRGGKFVKVAK